MTGRWQIRPEIRKLAAEADRAGPVVVVGAGGKGGSGTSLVLANLGIFLAQIGRRILLIDLARGGGSLHTMVGHPAARPDPGEPSEPDPRIEATPIAGLSLIAARPGDRRRAPRLGWRRWLGDETRRLGDRFDGFLFDAGTWPRGPGFDLFVHAPSPIVVLAPEPTGVEATLGFLRDAANRFLAHHPAHGAAVRAVLAASRAAPPSPAEILERIADGDEARAHELSRHLDAFTPGLVVNQLRVRSDFELGPAVESVARKLLGIPLRFLGAIEADDAIWKSVRLGRPLLVEAPSSKPAREIERIARLVLFPESAGRGATPPLRSPGRDETLYEALDVEHGASEEEIRKAYRRARELFSGNHIATRGHVGAADLRRLLARVEEAYETLVDARLRRPYDRRLQEETAAAPPRDAIASSVEAAGPEPSRPLAPPTPPAAPPLADDAEYTGALLRELRRRRGLERDDVATVTRIGSAYLRAIEEEDFDALPEEVFLKGYLRQIARVLALPEREVSETYLRRYRQGRRRFARRP